MKRNAVISACIGSLATYLPFWEWGSAGVQAVGAMVIGTVAFMLLFGTEKSPRAGKQTRTK